jgi:hypothetical protein
VIALADEPVVTDAACPDELFSGSAEDGGTWEAPTQSPSIECLLDNEACFLLLSG